MLPISFSCSTATSLLARKDAMRSGLLHATARRRLGPLWAGADQMKWLGFHVSHRFAVVFWSLEGQSCHGNDQNERGGQRACEE